MAQHMHIIDNGLSDSIRTFELDRASLFMVTVDREEVERAGAMVNSYLRKSGIYILMGPGNRRYVGQASEEILQRLRSHEKNKPWWTSVLCFGRLFRLSSDSLNHLEARLIRELKSLGFVMDNGNGGRTASAFAVSDLGADRLYEEMRGALDTHFHSELFVRMEASELRPKTGEKRAHEIPSVVTHLTPKTLPVLEAKAPPAPKDTFVINTPSLGVSVSGRSRRGTFIAWCRELMGDAACRSKMEAQAQLNKGLFFSSPVLGKNGALLTEPLSNSIHVYSTYSSSTVVTAVERIASLVAAKTTMGDSFFKDPTPRNVKPTVDRGISEEDMGLFADITVNNTPRSETS